MRQFSLMVFRRPDGKAVVNIESGRDRYGASDCAVVIMKDGPKLELRLREILDGCWSLEAAVDRLVELGGVEVDDSA